MLLINNEYTVSIGHRCSEFEAGLSAAAPAEQLPSFFCPSLEYLKLSIIIVLLLINYEYTVRIELQHSVLEAGSNAAATAEQLHGFLLF